MKIIQTFWSGEYDEKISLDIKAGWRFAEHNWMSWTLSAMLLRKKYEKLELYTDVRGKKILIDLLKLPYTKVHIVFDEESKIHPRLFALAKIKTYSLQKEPFIHIDGDLFLWNSFSKDLIDKEIIASNPELNLFFNKEILEDMEEHFQYIPDHLNDIHKQEQIFSANAGIFGGTNLKFVREYCLMAEKIIEKNEKCLQHVNIKLVNMLIEQVSLFYLARNKDVDITYYVSKPVEHSLYEDFWRFADVPDVSMIHPVGGCKQIPYVVYHLEKRLQMEFPSMYYSIVRLCKNDKIPLRGRLYNYLDLNDSEGFCDATILKHATNYSEIENLKPRLGQIYRRTWLVIQYYYPQMKFEHNDLKLIIEENKLNNSLQEIYTLETYAMACFENLLLGIKNGEFYKNEVNHYKNTTKFIIDDNWLRRKVSLKDEVVLLYLYKPWGNLNNSKIGISEVLESTDDEYCVTLSVDLTAITIHEGIHKELDAIILKLIQKPIYIEDLLVKLITYFDEELETGNPKYQLLIYDVLKRLAFENVIVVF